MRGLRTGGCGRRGRETKQRGRAHRRPPQAGCTLTPGGAAQHIQRLTTAIDLSALRKALGWLSETLMLARDAALFCTDAQALLAALERAL